MSFDKKRVLTFVTADKAKKGRAGWVSNEIDRLEVSVKQDPPSILTSDGGDTHHPDYPFSIEGGAYRYFYPTPIRARRLNSILLEGDVSEIPEKGRFRLISDVTIIDAHCPESMPFNLVVGAEVRIVGKLFSNMEDHGKYILAEHIEGKNLFDEEDEDEGQED